MTTQDYSAPGRGLPLNVFQYAKLGEPRLVPPAKQAIGGEASPRYANWEEFYEGRDNASYRFYAQRHYRPFLEEIRDALRPDEAALEVGCGLGTITRLLSGRCGRNTFLALDACQRMWMRAKANLRGRASVFHTDMRTCDWIYADVVHGHGVLEHLNDHDIYRTIEAHERSGAHTAIHYVPGEGHVTPPFGDERLLPLEWWVDKWDVTEAFAFNDGKDYVLIWRF